MLPFCSSDGLVFVNIMERDHTLFVLAAESPRFIPTGDSERDSER